MNLGEIISDWIKSNMIYGENKQYNKLIISILHDNNLMINKKSFNQEDIIDKLLLYFKDTFEDKASIELNLFNKAALLRMTSEMSMDQLKEAL